MDAFADRLRAWKLATRTRFALVRTGVNALLVTGVMAVGTGISRSELLVGIPVFFVALLLDAWVWYPRARRRADGSPRVTRPDPIRQ
jgi:hypothetical protein